MSQITRHIKTGKGGFSSTIVRPISKTTRNTCLKEYERPNVGMERFSGMHTSFLKVTLV